MLLRIFPAKLNRKDQDIAFFAYLGEDLVNPNSGRIVVFDEVVTNSGNNYNPVFGTFRAPVNGTYHFHFVGTSAETHDADHSFHLYLTKNSPGQHVGYGWLDRNTNV